MKHLLLLASFVILLTYKVSAQSKPIHIRLEDIAKHVGDSVSLCANISEREINHSTNTAIFYLGAKSPNDLLAVIIQDSNGRHLWFGYIENTIIHVEGRIERINGKLEMLVTEQNKIGLCSEIH